MQWPHTRQSSVCLNICRLFAVVRKVIGHTTSVFSYYVAGQSMGRATQSYLD